MRHSWFVPVLLVLAALAGYAVGARPVQAQAEQFPFQVGDIVEFSFQYDSGRQCRVEELKGTFARCGNPPDPRVFTIGRREPPELWVNVAVVESITKARKQK